MARSTTLSQGTLSKAKNPEVKGKISSYSVDKNGLYLTLLGTKNRGKVYHFPLSEPNYRASVAITIAAQAKQEAVTLETQHLFANKSAVYRAHTIALGASPYIPNP